MAYCDLNDLSKRFGENEINDLLDRNYDGLHDLQTLEMTISDADSLIDGYIGVRYKVPVIPTVPIIRAFSCDITRYLLWDDNAPDEVRKRYEDVIYRLKDYAKGLMILPNADKSEQNPSGGVDFITNERVFSQDILKGF